MISSKSEDISKFVSSFSIETKCTHYLFQSSPKFSMLYWTPIFLFSFEGIKPYLTFYETRTSQWHVPSHHILVLDICNKIEKLSLIHGHKNYGSEAPTTGHKM